MNQLIDKILDKTLWIWLPFYAFVLLLKEIREGKNDKGMTVIAPEWKKVGYGAALLLWMGVIFFLSSLPGAGTGYEPPLWYVVERKGAHVFEYAVLSILACLFLKQFRIFQSRWPLLYAGVAVFGLLYATSDEVHQVFVFGRSGRESDVMVDIVGILLGLYLFRVLKSHQEKK